MAILKSTSKNGVTSLLCLCLGLCAAMTYSSITEIRAGSATSASDIRLLIDRSSQLVSTQPDTAVELAIEARAAAKSIEDKELEVDALNNLALLYYRYDRKKEAEALLRDAVAIGRDIGYLRGVGIALNRLGNVLWLLEKRLEAKTCFEDALAISTDLGDWKEISRTKTNLANAYRYWDDYPRAIELFLEAREGYQKVDYQEGIAWLNYSLGILHKKLEDYDSALEAITSALNIYTKLAQKDGSNNGVLICYGQLGDIYNLTGKPEQGLEYNLRALQLREQSWNKTSIADGMTGIAKSHFFLGDFRQALEYFNKSQKLRDESGRTDGTATNMKFMGEIYLDRGEYDKALERFNLGLAAARELSDRDSESEILEMVADLHARQGRYKEAWDVFQQHRVAQNLILNAEISKRISSLQLKHEIEIQTTENERLQGENKIKDLQLARSRIQMILLILLSVFAVAGGIVAVYLHQKQLQIKTLGGLIPICTHCKSIRTDSGYYEQLETYISSHSDALFSHGICPKCYEKYYSDVLDDSDKPDAS